MVKPVAGRYWLDQATPPPTAYDQSPTLSETVKLALAPARPPSDCTVVLTSRWDVTMARLRTMLMVPAMACVLNPAVAARMISMRSISSGASPSSEKPGGAGSPLSRICV